MQKYGKLISAMQEKKNVMEGSDNVTGMARDKSGNGSRCIWTCLSVSEISL